MRCGALFIALTFLSACNVDQPTFAPELVDASDVDGALDASDAPTAITLIVTPIELAITEAGQSAFTVALSGPPAGPLPVSLQSSDSDKLTVTPFQLLFSTSDWMTPQTVTVSGRDDADVEDEIASVTVASGVTPTVTVAITVLDDDGLVIVASPAAGLEVTEGSTAPLDVRLSAQPSSTTVVTVMSSDTSSVTVAPTSLSFTVSNWNVEQTVLVTALDDADISDDVATLDLTATGLDGIGVGIRVIDDDVLGIRPSTTNLGSLPEGGAATFTVTLTQEPVAPIQVTVSSSDDGVLSVTPTLLTFTPTSWNVPATVSVTAPDDLDIATENAELSLVAAGLATRTIAATVTDDDVQSLVSAPVPLAIDEGGTRDLNVRLAYQPAADVTVMVTSLNPAVAMVTPATLTFTAADYDVNQIVTASAPDDVDAAPGMSAIRLESPAAGLLADVPVTVTDDDQLTLETSVNAVSVSEAGMATFGVRLTAMPVASVAVNVSSGDPSAVSVTPATLGFTTSNWNGFQNVTVRGVDDLDLASELITVTLAASGLPAKTVDVNVSDDDTQAVVVAPSTISVNEAGTATVGVSLRHTPSANVTVALASAEPAVATVSPSTLTFTPSNHATPQAIVVAGVDDPDTADGVTTITATSAGAISGMVTVTVNDDDTLGIETSVTTMTLAEAGTASLGVRLTAPPPGDVTMSLASSDPGAATLSVSSLTFTSTNWSVSQNVNVGGVDDADAANESVTISVAGAGLVTRTVAVTVTDDDPQRIVTSVATVTTTEGGTGSFGVHLAAQPPGDVVVMINSTDITVASVAPATLTFTPSNYAIDQPVTVSGLHDNDLVDEQVVIGLSSSGLPTTTVTAAIADDDQQVIVLSPAAITVGEGVTGTVAVSLGFAPLSDVTVTLTSASGSVATVNPATLVFTTASYATPQPITIAGSEDADAIDSTTTIDVRATGVAPASIAVTVDDNDTLGIQTSDSALSVVEGSPRAVGVRLSAQPVSTATVSLASSDTTAATVAPSTLTFTSGDWNVYKNVQVSGVEDLDAINEAATLTLSAAGMVSRQVNVTVTDDEVQAIVASAATVTVGEGGTASFGVHLAAMPAANVTVTITSADAGAATIAPASLTFTPATYATDQTITVNGIADLDLADESVAITLSSPGLASLVVTAAVVDDDTQVVVASTGTLSLTEGNSGSLGLRLEFIPAGTVTVSVTSASTSVATVSPSTLTFSPGDYNLVQSVTVTAAHDADLVAGSTTVTAAASSPGATAASVAVNVTDDDSQVVVLEPATLSLTEGTSSSQIGARLGFMPSGNVTVNLASSNPAVVTVSPATLTFTPTSFATPQTLTIAAPHDDDVASGMASITGQAPGATAGSTAVSITDDDTQTLIVTPSSRIVNEAGGTGSFSVSLMYRPAADVTVSVASSDTTAVTVSPTSLTFTPLDYNSPRTVTALGRVDADAVNEVVTVTLASPGITSQTIAVTQRDDDLIDLRPSSLSLLTCEVGFLSVALRGPPLSTMTVSLSTGSTLVSLSEYSVTFTTSNWSTSQSIQVNASGSTGTTTITGSAATQVGDTSTVQVSAGDSCPGF